MLPRTGHGVVIKNFAIKNHAFPLCQGLQLQNLILEVENGGRYRIRTYDFHRVKMALYR